MDGMLLQVDPKTLGTNLWLIIAGLILAIVALAALLVLVVALRVAWSIRARKKAQSEYHKSSRRADGQPYPPYLEAVCSQCGRGDTKIYHPSPGQRLCPDCYESFWRRETGWDSDETAPPSKKK